MRFQRFSRLGLLAAALAFTGLAAQAQTYNVRILLSGGEGSAAPTYGSVQLSSATLDFGALNVGDSAMRAMSVHNAGSNPARVLGVSTDHAAFSASHDCPAVLDAGSSCVVSVTAAPTGVGSLSQLLTVTDSRGAHNATLLAVAGSPAVSLTGNGNFGTVHVGASSVASFTVTNNGSGSLSLDSLAVTGEDVFSITGGSCSVGQALGASASCQVQVTAAPGSGGLLNGSLSVTGAGQNASQALSVTVPDPATASIQSLNASPAELVADGLATSSLTAQLRDAAGRALGAGHTVTWSATLGTVSPASSQTDADGRAQATFTTGTQAGSAAVSAQFGTSSPASATIAMTADVASAHVDQITVDDEVAAGKTTTATARVRDAHGNPVGAGITVHWGVMHGTTTDMPTSTTNAEGVASLEITAPTTVGPMLVMAVIQSGYSESATITVTPDFESRRVVTVQTDTDSVMGTGGVPVVVETWSQDQYGNPIAGDTVELSATGGNFANATLTADADGYASGLFLAPAAYLTDVSGITQLTLSATSQGTGFPRSTTINVQQTLHASQFAYDESASVVTQHTGLSLNYVWFYYANEHGQGNLAAGGTWVPGPAGAKPIAQFSQSWLCMGPLKQGVTFNSGTKSFNILPTGTRIQGMSCP